MGSEQSDGFTSFPEKVVLRSGFFPNKLCLTVNLQPSNRVVITGGNFVHLLPSLFSRLQQERKRFSVLSIDLGRRVSKALSVHQLSGCPSAVLVRAPAAPGEDWRGRWEGGTGDDDGSLSLSFPLFPLLFKTLLPRPPLSSGVAARLG